MEYRRFGRTELQMPVISCGGMRYQQGWGDINPDDITDACQQNLEACIRRSLELGITHIETARGYGSSEYQLGKILPDLPRDDIIVQTKVPVKDTPEAFLADFDTSMENLKLDYVDLLGIHGINNHDLFDTVINGGILEAAETLRAQGRVRHIGFSTHASNHLLLDVINSGVFDYINLHYFFFDQRNLQTIKAAAEQDMGVFIISPTEKGGWLHKPSDKLRTLCEPLHPITFNGLWCLSDPRVHTLSCGVAKPEEFNEIVDAVPLIPQADTHLPPIIDRINTAMEEVLGREWLDSWQTNLPHWFQVPGEVQLYHTLRLYNLYKGLDMVEYAQARYRLLGNGGHWFPGVKVDQMDWDNLPDVLEAAPMKERIIEALHEAHDAFGGEEVKRLSQS